MKEMKTIRYAGLLLAILVSGCALSVDTVRDVPERVYRLPSDRVWDITLRVLDQKGFKVVSTDPEYGFIDTSFKTGLDHVWGIQRYRYFITIIPTGKNRTELTVETRQDAVGLFASAISAESKRRTMQLLKAIDKVLIEEQRLF